MTDTTPWTVTDADRKAAACRLDLRPGHAWTVLARECRAGARDDEELVQAFAKHRHEAQAELVEELQFARGLLAHSDAESGYCMCGSPTKTHDMASGHSPLDSHVYEAGRFVERIDALLAKVSGQSA
jgi:hypothetical protein